MENSKTLAIVNDVNFIKSGNVIIASLMIDDFICLDEVKKAAKIAGLPVSGWVRSEYTESYILKV